MNTMTGIIPSTPLDTTQPLSQWLAAGAKLGQLSAYNLPADGIKPLLRTLRYANTALDALFYDVQLLWLRLYTRGVTLSTQMAPEAASSLEAVRVAAIRLINLSSEASPEGTILAIDAHRPPFVAQYDSVDAFLKDGLLFPNSAEAAELKIAPRPIHAIAVTGVGSSALGSAAFAWNVSEALHKPVAAIVPGYGIADVVSQSLSGWFGFGMHDFLRRMTQQALANAAPELAKIGRALLSSTPEVEAEPSAPLEFRTGSPESDILHAILTAAPQIKRLYGHSKGALCLQNAVRSLPPERYEDLHLTTFGCVVGEEQPLDYNQVLGGVDGLGQMNSWGNWPESWIATWHSTNTMLPLTMHIGDLVTQDVRDEDPVKVDPVQLERALKAALKAVNPANA